MWKSFRSEALCSPATILQISFFPRVHLFPHRAFPRLAKPSSWKLKGSVLKEYSNPFGMTAYRSDFPLTVILAYSSYFERGQKVVINFKFKVQKSFKLVYVLL